MKNLKIFTALFLSISFFACNSDDDTDVQTDVPSLTFDVSSVIALGPNSDITNLVSFNGQNAGLYTSDLNVGSSVRVGRPEGLGANDVFTYSSIVVSADIDGELIELQFDETTRISDDGNLQFIIPAGQPSNYFDLDLITVFEIQAIDADATADLDYKYLLEVFIERDNIEYGPYIIDPKIRIKSLN